MSVKVNILRATMMNQMMYRGVVATLVLTGILVSDAHLRAQDTSQLVSELVQLLNASQLDAIAAKDPDSDDLFVAALSFPGQLLVVWSRYEVPLYVNEKIANQDYREVYLDLNGAAIPNTKVLITDLGADGLSGGGEDAAPDMVDTGSGPAAYSGDTDIAAQYARMLEALIAEAR